jgi:hypothetical protein
VDSLSSGSSHCPPRALLTICRSFLRGSIRCLAIASPVAPCARVAISTQHFSPAPMCSHCTPTARRKTIAVTQTPPVASNSAVVARQTTAIGAWQQRRACKPPEHIPGPWNWQSRSWSRNHAKPRCAPSLDAPVPAVRAKTWTRPHRLYPRNTGRTIPGPWRRGEGAD